MGIPDDPDRRVDSFLQESFGEPHRGVLAAGIIVMKQASQNLTPSRLRVKIAWLIAARTRSVVIDVDTFQPRMRRA